MWLAPHINSDNKRDFLSCTQYNTNIASQPIMLSAQVSGAKVKDAKQFYDSKVINFHPTLNWHFHVASSPVRVQDVLQLKAGGQMRNQLSAKVKYKHYMIVMPTSMCRLMFVVEALLQFQYLQTCMIFPSMIVLANKTIQNSLTRTEKLKYRYIL